MRPIHLLAMLLLHLLGGSCLAASVHPQDGPHADLRVEIIDEFVRYSVGVNLAFLDETIEVPREALNELSPEESDRVLDAFREYLIENASCSINGTPVEPVFERLEMFTHPDPGMLAIFPKMGARALIRATVVMRFDAPSPADSVEVTWPAYPLDLLAEEMEAASTAPPRMYFEAVFTAGGKTIPSRFTQAEPTLRWSRSDGDEADPLTELPPPTVVAGSNSSVFTFVLLVGLVVLATSAGFVQKKWPTVSRSLGIACVIIAGALIFQAAVTPGARASAQPLLAEADAERVLQTLHKSMYRAFDYTSESDIYDRLAFALDGDLLGELYEQIRLSLLQAEEEMKVGVVTDLDPIEIVILETDDAAAVSEGLGFLCEYRWRVDGTVYHWGHSHTRAHVYEAHYRVTYTADGWRITEHELRSQERVDPSDGSPFHDSQSIQEQLESLGFPDI